MNSRTFLVAGLSAVAVGALGEATACPANHPMVGVVQQVTGERTDVFVERQGEARFRPAPLDVLCAGDVVVSTSMGATVTYRLEGAGSSTQMRGPARTELAGGGARADVADNALQILLDTWMPDMRRTSNFGVVRGRTDGPARWSFAGLSGGEAVITAGAHPLLLRWEGPAARYHLQIARADGALVADMEALTPEVRVPMQTWAPGAYVVRLLEVDGNTPVLAGRFQVATATSPTTDAQAYGAEIGAAAEGLRLAHTDTRRFSLQAVQIVDAAPAQGLDRDAVYRALGALNEDE